MGTFLTDFYIVKEADNFSVLWLCFPVILPFPSRKRPLPQRLGQSSSHQRSEESRLWRPAQGLMTSEQHSQLRCPLQTLQACSKLPPPCTISVPVFHSQTCTAALNQLSGICNMYLKSVREEKVWEWRRKTGYEGQIKTFVLLSLSQILVKVSWSFMNS